MKTRSRLKRRGQWPRRLLAAGVSAAGALWLGGHGAAAAETNATLTAEQMFEGGEEALNNWIEIGAGGFMTRGSEAQAQERRRLANGGFGGIEDLHLQQTVATNTVLTIDGRALYDQGDYKLRLDLKREALGYVRLNFENARFWQNGAGGYFPPLGMQYHLGGDELELDRGEISFEAGLTLEKAPKVRFKYTHRYRDGEKASTMWGPVHPYGNALTRALSPSYYDLDETADIFELDVNHKIKATDLGVGLRFETGELNNALKTNPWQGGAGETKVTDRQGTSYDMVSLHTFTETWIKKKLLFTTGFLFANLDNTFSGSRVYGQDFDVGYAPGALNGLGYFDLNGGSQKNEYVVNLNLQSTHLKNLVITPSIRAQYEDWSADSAGTGTLGLQSGPFRSWSDREATDVRERIDLRYTGLTNWVFYGAAEWTQGEGNLNESGGLSQINSVGVPAILRETEDSRFFQKYPIGARWYPTYYMSLDVGGYFKDNDYDYRHLQDSATMAYDRYPAYFTMLGFQTYDGNTRLTLRPVKNVTLVSRYEYQWSTVDTRMDQAEGSGETEASHLTSHIIAQNVTWVPWSRLSLQAGFNYVISETVSPVSSQTQAILDAQNNYWTLNFNATLVLDDKTDLNLGYFYYQADNDEGDSYAGVPYGVGTDEHGITALVTRRISPALRLNLKYGYYRSDDATSGGHNDYEAHVVYSSLQYRF